jgi:hypothetical protein
MSGAVAVAVMAALLIGIPLGATFTVFVAAMLIQGVLALFTDWYRT